MGNFCRACGAELAAGAEYCSECGTGVGADPRTVSPTEAAEAATETRASPSDESRRAPEAAAGSADQGDIVATPAPTWPLLGIGGCWVVGTVGLLAAQSSPALGALALLGVLASLPLLYVDASKAAEAGELDLDYPILVPVAVLLLWVLTVPAYVGYRFVTR